MIGRLFLIASLLAPILAYAAVSSNLSVQVVPAGTPGTGACNNQPVPAPAQAAGYTTLVKCMDFTDPANANISSWLGNCGGPNPPAMYYASGALTSATRVAPHCSEFNIISDSGTNVLSIEYTQADANLGNWAVNELSSCGPEEPAPFNNCWFYTDSVYAEMTFRFSNNTATVPSFPYLFDFWGEDGYIGIDRNTAEMEWDYLETNSITAASSTGTQWNYQSSGSPVGGSTNQVTIPGNLHNYNTIGTLLTTDASGNTADCPYWNGAAVNPGTGNCQQPSGISNPLGTSFATQPFFSRIIGTRAPDGAGNPTAVYIKSVRFWACSTTSSQSTPAGTVAHVIGPCPAFITTAP